MNTLFYYSKFISIIVLMLFSYCYVSNESVENNKITKQENMNNEITVVGIAENGKAGAFILTEKNRTYYLSGIDSWEDTVCYKKIEVVGFLQKETFKEEDLKDETGAWTQGMVGDKLTILKPNWKVVENHSIITNIQDSFKIEIVNKYFGRKNHITTITDDSLIIERNLVHRNDYTKEGRSITEEEKNYIASFLETFPVDDFKTGYYNKGVHDGTQMTFLIEITGKSKEIGVSNYYIKELGELVIAVNKLLQEEYEIWYTTENCPKVIEK